MFTVVIVDDYILIRRALSHLIRNFNSEFQVIYEASSGKELLDQLLRDKIPDIVVLDVILPGMCGFEIAGILRKEYPSIRVIAISAFHDVQVVEKMRLVGAMGFVTKDVDPAIFQNALNTVSRGNHFFPAYSMSIGEVAPCCARRQQVSSMQLNNKELEFLKLCATEMTYKEIASRMKVKTRTVDNYRDSLFEKLNVMSRSGLILIALKLGLAELK